MRKRPHHVVVVGGGTAGCVLAARLSESSRFAVTLLEVGADDSSYGEVLLDPRRTPEAWTGHAPAAFTVMQGVPADVAVFQGRVLGGTSAANGMATLRGLPVDYDGWAAMGLDGWGWDDVADTFIAAERDLDFGSSSLHGDSGPLPVRRWRRNEHSRPCRLPRRDARTRRASRGRHQRCRPASRHRRLSRDDRRSRSPGVDEHGLPHADRAA
ncbi:MAG: GMC family oxidoreductase N-terminal domain-containing protein [Ilumatobacteraceae bacterium]